MIFRFLLVVCALAASACAQSDPLHLRLIWHQDPAHEAIVAWTERSRPQAPAVEYAYERPAGENTAWPLRQEATRTGQHSGEEPWYVHVHLKGLKPDRTVWLRLRHGDGAVSRPFWFRTASDADPTVHFLSGGDSRSDPERRRAMNRRVARLFEERPELLALAHGGDYVASGRRWGQWDQWLDDHQHTTTKDRRLCPVIPARGNHEATGPLYDEIFAWPGGGGPKNWFATLLSKEVLLVTLNTNVPAGGDQRAFLERTLRENASRRWKTVQYHRPLYPAVKRPARAKPHWLPVFDSMGVSLALENDGHVLRRTVRLKGDRPHREGVLYIGEGGMGVPQRKPRARRKYYSEGGYATSAHHVWVVSLGKSKGLVEAIGEHGDVLDRATLTPRR